MLPPDKEHKVEGLPDNDPPLFRWDLDPMSMPDVDIPATVWPIYDYGTDTITFETALQIEEDIEPQKVRQPLVIPRIETPKAKMEKWTRTKRVFKPFSSLEVTELTVRQLQLFYSVNQK